MTAPPELFVSVDIEASGPVPGEFSMLTLGACLVDDPSRTYECEFKPLNQNADAKALEVTGLSLDDLEVRGRRPEDCMADFEGWLLSGIPEGSRPVFVGLNAPFDWSFVNYYFHRFLGRNPFGFAALDIKAYFMGVTGCRWSESGSSSMARALGVEPTGNHRALRDALFQAELFRGIRDRRAFLQSASEAARQV